MAYVGEYRERLRDGRGEYTFPGGYYKYNGQWARGKMDGRGTFSMGDGGSYEGEFVNGEIDGIGLRRWPDGATYSGQFVRGERHGEGVYMAANGDVYEGQWRSNRRHGQGQLTLANGDIYRGEFREHWPNGAGQMIFAQHGSVYDGEWVAGERTGHGKLTNGRGDLLYEGSWHRGHREGNGTGIVAGVMNLDGSLITYTGHWHDDRPSTPVCRLICRTIETGSPSLPVPENRDVINNTSALIIEKKNQYRLPTLIVLGTDDNGVASTASHESGRQLRLRVFEGQAPAEVADKATEPQVGQWFFVQSLSKPEDDRSNGDVPTKIPSHLHESTEPADELADIRQDEIVMYNVKGLATFENLALPESSLLGNYYIICDSLANDGIPVLYVSLSLVE